VEARRVSMFGTDLSGPRSARPKKGVMGQTFFDEDEGRLLFYDSRAQAWFSADGIPVWNASLPPNRYISDHFGLNTLSTKWTVNKGSDAQAVNPVIVSHEGKVRLETGDAGTGLAADGSAMSGPVVFEAEEGKMRFAVRLKVDTAQKIRFFVGFTDTAVSTLEMPFSLSGTTYTSTATDGCGFLWDPAATTDTLRGVGVANDVDATHLDLGVAMADDTFVDLRMTVSTAGLAKFWVNDLYKGSVAAATRVGIDLCPVLVAVTTEAVTHKLDAEFIHAS
jgi:hypothetical protein